MDNVANETRSFTAFARDRLVGSGTMPTVLRAVKRHLEGAPNEMVLVFDDQTGEQIDFDLRGSVDEVIERALPPRSQPGPGRPRLGVVSREVSLLPRHWEWLEGQPASVSATLRRLIEDARRREPGKQRARAARTALSRVMTALAGDRHGYEEASRALFAHDVTRFLDLIRRWPPDIRTHLTRMVHQCADLERESSA